MGAAHLKNMNRSSIGDRRPSAVDARDRTFSDLELRKHPCGVWALPIHRRIDGFSKLPKRVQFCIGLVAKQHSLLSSTDGGRASSDLANRSPSVTVSNLHKCRAASKVSR